MLIALVGSVCSGKDTVASYLVRNHGFIWVRIRRGAQSSTSLPADLDKGDSLTFDSPAQFLAHSTANWRTHFVTVDLQQTVDLEVGFDKRPFFLLVSVEAPLMVRFARRNAVATRRGQPRIGLEEFVAAEDEHLYGISVNQSNGHHKYNNHATAAEEPTSSAPSLARSHSSTPGVALTSATSNLNLGPSDVTLSGAPSLHPSSSLGASDCPISPTTLYPVLLQAQLRIFNPYRTVSELERHLDKLNLTSSERLRPSWETYFLSLCTLASLRSNCMKRRVGAVLVRNNRVLSTGYNGTPRGLPNCNQGGCPRCNDSDNAACGVKLDQCLCLHAEENALLECGREKGGAEGTVLYCNTCPCLRCAVKIVQVGVKEVVYQLDYSVDHRSADIFETAGVKFRKYGQP
ncbi:unnamed protein product [Jaminaea pallidilutea]